MSFNKIDNLKSVYFIKCSIYIVFNCMDKNVSKTIDETKVSDLDDIHGEYTEYAYLIVMVL